MDCKKFEDKIAESVSKNSLFTGTKPVGVALSGGADSVALLVALRTLGYECEALHCNFHLRGDESDRDCQVAQNIAELTGTRWNIIDFDVVARMKLTGESVEMACRELRYGWFERMYTLLGLDAVAIAHHRDDRVETFMLNAMRGTGLRGLASMRPRRGIYVRPMLGCTRSEIESYLAEKGIDFVTDSSNLSDDYTRNRVRHHVLPALRKVRNDALERISETMGRIDDTRTLYEHMIAEKKRKYVSVDGKIDLSGLLEKESDVARQLLYELVSHNGVNMSQTIDIISSAGESGRRFGPYLLDRGELLLMGDDDVLRAENPIKWIPGNDPIKIMEIDRADFAPRRDPNCMYIDGRAFQGNPEWEIRPWKHGDRFQPFGMKGSRLVSDLLSDAKYSLEQKKKVRLLTRNGDIIWVIGLRASSHFKVSDDTRQIIKLTAMSE